MVSARGRYRVGTRRRAARTRRSPSSNRVTANSSVTTAARAPPASDRPARVNGAVLRLSLSGSSWIAFCTLAGTSAFSSGCPMTGSRPISCTTCGSCLRSCLAWCTAGGTIRAARPDRAATNTTTTMATDPERPTCVVRCTHRTTGSVARAMMAAITSAVTVRGVSRTIPVTASRPTNAPSTTRTERQSRSTRRTTPPAPAGAGPVVDGAGTGVTLSPAATPVLYRPMGPPQPIDRLRLTPRSAVLAVALFGAGFAALRIVSHSQRVIGWILAAAALAGLLHPMCARLRRFMPNGLAVLLVMLMTIGATGLVAWGAVGGIVRETKVLQAAAPKRAAELERSKRFGKLARQFKLVEKTKRLVKEAPEKLRGGTPAQAIRAATTRGVAFLATAVLTLFLLLHAPTMARAGAKQIRDPVVRQRVGRVAVNSYRRAFGYARGTILMGAAVGLLAFAVARMADVPGAAPLGLWAGLWDAVPLIGAFVGALPIIGLA